MPKLLVIDDDEQYRVMVRRMLEAGGHKVIDASNASTGYDLFVGESPDLIITDIRMPGMSGLDLLNRVRSEYPGIGVGVGLQPTHLMYVKSPI